MTARVDFYLLERGDSRQRDLLACRLTEKAYLQNLQVLVLMSDEPAAQAFDELLWKFDDSAFVPHERWTTATARDARTPVHIGSSAPLEPGHGSPIDLLVNLGDHDPTQLTGFERIVEIIDGDETRREIRRARFKFYRSLNVALNTHRMDS